MLLYDDDPWHVPDLEGSWYLPLNGCMAEVLWSGIWLLESSLKCVQHTTGSHTQPWLIPSQVDAMNRILRCAHVQQGVWSRSVFPTVSCLWCRSLFQHVKRVAAGVTISTWQPLCTTLDNASVPCVTLLHCSFFQGIDVNESMLVSNAQPSATVKSRALIRPNNEGGYDQ